MMRQETKRLATITVLLGFFVIMLDTTIVNVSLAHIGKDLHGTTASLQWVVDAYTLSFAALLLSAGTACDRLGSQRIYLFGLILKLIQLLGKSIYDNRRKIRKKMLSSLSFLTYRD